jgi:hypothetical protein
MRDKQDTKTVLDFADSYPTVEVHKEQHCCSVSNNAIRVIPISAARL